MNLMISMTALFVSKWRIVVVEANGDRKADPARLSIKDDKPS